MTQIEWPRDCDFVTIRSPNAIITRKEIEDELDGQDDTITRRVKVVTMDIEWLYRDKANFVAFCTLLEDLPSAVYSSEFLQCILD